MFSVIIKSIKQFFCFISRKLPLRIVLTIPFIFQLIVIVSIIGYLSFNHIQQISNELTRQLQNKVSYAIQEKLRTYIETPHLVNRLNANTVSFTHLETQQHDTKVHFLEHLQTFPLISQVFMANENGHIVGARRLTHDKLQIFEFKNNQQVLYNVNGAGEFELFSGTTNANKQNLYPWYDNAMLAPQSAWSHIYTDNTTQLSTITAILPMYNKKEELRHVFGSSFTFSHINQFIEQLKIGRSGYAFILEQNGHLITANSDNYLVKVAIQQIFKTFPDLNHIQNTQYLNFVEQGEQFFLQLTSLQDQWGLDWLTVVAVPASDFTNHIEANIRSTLLIALIAIAIAIFVSIMTARWIVCPIRRLNQVAKTFAKGKWNLSKINIDIERKDELGQLATSFKKMAEQLQDLFIVLEDNEAMLRHSNQVLEQKVETRTQEMLDKNQLLEKEISLHQRTELELRASEERFHLAMLGASDGLWDWYLEKNTMYLSPRWKQMLGYQDNEIPSQFEVWHQYLHPKDYPRVIADIYAYLNRETLSYECSYRIRHKDGHYLWMLERGIAIWSQSGKPVRMVGTNRDLTIQKQAEEKLHQAKAAAESASQAKSTFLANMSHELRTPLNGILGYTQILSRGKSLTLKQQEGIDIIHRSGEYLLTLINDILDISKIEADKIELCLIDFNFNEFLQNITKLFQFRAEQKGITFSYQKLSHLPVAVRADEKRLRQILINLLNNAIKFTQAGSVTFKIGYHNGNIRFQVEDTGIGIAQSEHSQIFQPFQQVGEQKYHSEGTGLGLTITKKLVEMMQGELHVESVLNQGSTFWVALPLAEAPHFELQTSTETKTIIGYCGKPYKIMVVDDKKENRLVLINILNPLGFEMTEACNGEECLIRAKNVLPDLILMDLVMPVMDGFKATQQIKQLPTLEKTVVIMASASVFDFHQQASLEAGCDDFLTKPIHTPILLNCLQRHLSLTWLYEPPDENEVASLFNATTIVKLSGEQAATLLNLATIGDINGILEEVEKLEELGEAIKPLAHKIRQLAKNFELEKICELAKKQIA